MNFVVARYNAKHMIRKFMSCVLVIGILCLSAQVSAATYYISATGNDSNNGTSSTTPWQNLTKIGATSLTGGDFVLLKRGDVFATSSLDLFNKSGTSTNPLTIGAYGTGANPRISRPNSYAISLGGNTSNIIITDIDANSTTTGALPHAIYLYNTGSNITLNNMSVATTSTGIQFDSTANINGITINNFTTTGPASKAINVAGTVNNLTIASTTIRNSSNGISIAPSATTTNVIITNADIRNLTGSAINLGKVDGITISNSNLISNGIGIGTGPGANQMTKNFTIASTTVSSSTSYGIIFQNPTQNLTITNVLVEKSGNHGIWFQSSANNFAITNSTSTRNASTSSVGLTFTSYASGTISNMNLNYNNFSGFNASNAGSVYATNVEASYNTQDGFDAGGTTYFVCDRCIANENGDDGIGGDGDGYSFHDTSTGIIKNSFAMNNKEAAVYNVHTASVNLFNNIFVHDTIGTLPLVKLFGQHTVSNNIILSKAQQGTGIELVATSTAQNNSVYGFFNGISGNSNATAQYNNVYNNASSSYVCQTTCITAGIGSRNSNPYFANFEGGDYTLSTFSDLIDAGTTTTGRTVDYEGNPIYGTPDIGPYEFQPTLTVNASTTPFNASAGIRIYGNGKYRELRAATANVSIDLSATPLDGYTPESYVEYLTISNITSTQYIKQWTASSSVATSTRFNLRDLVPNTLYTITIDGVTSTTSTSLPDGTLTFVYSGGWSTHVFTVSAPEPVTVTSQRTSTVTGYGSTNTPYINPQATITADPVLISPSVISGLKKNLYFGINSPDVKILQQYLNSKGYAVSKIGIGSTGKETTYFGPATRAALIRFQKAYAISPAVGFFGPVTRAFILNK